MSGQRLRLLATTTREKCGLAGQLKAQPLRTIFQEIGQWVYENSGIEFPARDLRFDTYENARGKISGEGRIYYRGPIAPGGNLPRIKLDLTEDEVVVLASEARTVHHPYSDCPDGGYTAQCYPYEEIFAEKIRALAERTRPRDLYDVVNLYRREESQESAPRVLMVLTRKCEFKDISVPCLADLEPVYSEVDADWEHMLAHQLPALPPIESFWSALSEFFAWLTRERPIPLIRPQVPAPPDTFPVVGDLRGQGFNSSEISILETIRFAATNRLCVDLDYLTLGGVRSSRLIEPYSLRRTSEGNVILHAIRAETGESRSYRVDRIQGAAVSEKAFTPRYTVEFTTFGTLGIPESSPRQSIKQNSEPSFKSALPRRGRASGQSATYIYECTWCEKRFRRKTQNPESRPHKGPDGWPCPGRSSYLVDVRY